MNTLYKALPIVLSLSLMGCNETASIENTTSVEEPTVTTQTGTTTKTTEDDYQSPLPDSAQTLKVGTSTPAPPFIFKDEYGTLQGIDVDVIRAIGEDQGFKVEIYNDPWEMLFENVELGERDLAIAGISYNSERAEKYGLSNSYFFNPSAVMYLDSSLTINGLEDLQGLRVASNPGTKQLEQMRELGGYAELVETDTVFLMYQQLVQNKIDAAILDMPILKYTASSFPDQNVQIVPYEGEDTPESKTVILMEKGNTELMSKVNAGIKNLKANGEMEKIENKWLNSSNTK